MSTHKHATTIKALANSIADKSLTIDHLATLTREATQTASIDGILGHLLELQPHIDTLKAVNDPALAQSTEGGSCEGNQASSR